MDQNDLLQIRLDQNYRDYVARLQGKTADELIALAPEIVAAQQLRDDLKAPLFNFLRRQIFYFRMFHIQSP